MNDTRINRYKIEAEQNWRDEIKNIPFIKFPADWQIQIIPPFGDAVIRFRVKLPSGTEKSIYMDSRSSIGYMMNEYNQPIPYWEVYPYCVDVGRCYLNEVDRLLEMIADESEGLTND